MFVNDFELLLWLMDRLGTLLKNYGLQWMEWIGQNGIWKKGYKSYQYVNYYTIIGIYMYNNYKDFNDIIKIWV